MPTEQRGPTQKHARAIVLLALRNAGKLNDEMISEQEGAIFLDKPFPEWPKELQDKLRPYGADMIR